MSQATQPDQFLRQWKLEDSTPVARKELSGWVFGNFYLFVNSVFSRSVRSKLMWRDFKASPRGRRCERSGGAARAYEVQPRLPRRLPWLEEMNGRGQPLGGDIIYRHSCFILNEKLRGVVFW